MSNECMKEHMEHMTPEMVELHRKIDEAHKDMNPDEMKTFNEIMEQLHHPYGMNDCHHDMSTHHDFIGKFEEMNAKLDKIMKALEIE